MPESLALRTLQLPPSGKAVPGPAGMPDESTGADFHAVLEQQLGGTPALGKADHLPESASGQDPATEPAESEAAGMPSGAVDAAAALVAMQAAVASVQASAPRAGEQPVSTKGTTGESRVEGLRDAAAVMTGADAEEEPPIPAIPAAPPEDTAALLPEAGAERAPLQVSGNVPPAADPTVTHGVERRAEVSPRHAPTAASPLEEPVSMARRSFASDVGDRVLWMASNNRQVAELRIDPPQLGPVEVRLSISGEQASLTLVAAHAGVREALQASIPRLQDMIQSIGLELGNVTVGSDASPGQQEQFHERSGRHAGGPAREPSAMTDSRAWVPARAGLGLVDTYA